MSHFSPINATSPAQSVQTEAVMTPSPSKFSSRLEIPDSEAESESDDDMDDGLESEDEESEESMDEDQDDDSEESENDHEQPRSDIEMSEREIEKDLETETEKSPSPVDFEVNAPILLQVPKLSFKELQKQRQQIIAGSSKYESTYIPTKSITTDMENLLSI